MFEIVGIRDPSNVLSNNFYLRTRLMHQPTRCHGGYLRGRRAFPLNLPPAETLKIVNTKFQEPKATGAPLSPYARAPIPQWMYEDSLRMIDARDDLRRHQDHNRNVACTIMRSVRRSLTVESRRRVDVDEEDIGACMETPNGTPLDIQGDNTIMKRWCRHVLKKNPTLQGWIWRRSLGTTLQFSSRRTRPLWGG